MTKTLLIADDDATIRTVLTHALKNMPFDIQVTESAQQLSAWIKQGRGDCVLTDVTMQDGNGIDILQMAVATRPELPVVVMSAQNTVLTAIQASSHGAFEYLSKPFDLNDLKNILQKALENTPEQTVPADTDTSKLPIIGSSPSMQLLYRNIARLVPSDETVLVHGESGTGKELVARTLHDFGGRKNKPFIPLNMGAIPKDLIESELFGYEKGAFTGADTARKGKFLQADGGTLFLDEIGDMPLDSQTRLLRVLQEGEVSPIGSAKTYTCNVRIISASHRNLMEMVDNGDFRQDLYYRLNVMPLYIPALRDRLDDIDDLIRYFQEQSGMLDKVFTADALAILKQYSWPGNVRELENFVRRANIMLPGTQVDAHNVVTILGENAVFETPGVSTDTPVIGESYPPPAHIDSNNFYKVAEQYAHVFFQSEYDNNTQKYHGAVYNHFIAQVEKSLIQTALNYCGGNQIKTSELLGINRNTLRKRIHGLHIDIIKKAGSCG